MAGGARSRGLYEVLITEALHKALATTSASLHPESGSLPAAEAADRIALHLSRVIARAVAAVDEDDRVAVGVELADRLLAGIDAVVSDVDARSEALVKPGLILRALLARLPDGSVETLQAPLIPLLDSALLTNSPGEPRVGHQVLAEVASADRIDLVMAFIRRSGVRPLEEALRRHCESGRPLRVLTTIYTASTEAAALDMLRAVGAEVRVSYDTTTTRLHAKAWLFHRDSGFSTAYIGSSNLTHSAQVSGLEWNLRISAARNPHVIDKVTAVFETYWSSGDFTPYERAQFIEIAAVEASRGRLISPIELRPEPFQERLLEQIAVSRQFGRHRNLLVSATGTGKTVMAALDYASLRQVLPRARLLFVAHREEILDQALRTFRHGLREPSFGELWVGGRRPHRFEHVFASIQSLNAAGLEAMDSQHFDVVIVDEFHHAAAASYRALLDRIKPVELLGLTATPERTDGLPILSWFDNRISAELRLWDAIDQHRLTPFHYYGVHDNLDLREVPWRRGRGYDVDALTRVFTANDAWAKQVLKALEDHVDPQAMRALGFCVSVAHARFMADVFARHQIPAVAIWSDSPEMERRQALVDLASGAVKVVFSVDLFNEGVDVPVVDTLLLLRPTDSPTLFLQQLGRGLRRSPGKTECTVLDFVGHQRKEFRFDRRLRALLGGTRNEIEKQVKDGFPFLPAGCHMQLDPVATEIVLKSIREAVPSRWTAKVEELRALHALVGARLSLVDYLAATGLDLIDIYASDRSWSDLCQEAGVATLDPGPHERALRRACGRMLHVDDRIRIGVFRRFLGDPAVNELGDLSAHDRRLVRMLVASIAGEVLPKGMALEDACGLVWSHPQVCRELLEIMDVLEAGIDHVHHPLEGNPDVPLQVHARYSRLEILAAFGVGSDARVAPWQAGVYFASDARADLFAFTLDKTSGGFSPTTRYRDYAISHELVHWESQSSTRSDSETGLRYRNHAAQGSSIMLFARLRSDDRAFWFLGPATYVRHESEMPMAITWRLHVPLPGDLYATFAAAVA
jgi:superfamily II DNA or RNA helicase/HKD family nuclease